MHETGFKTALTRVINNYGQKYNIIKGDDKVSGEDVREGISAVISVKLPEAQFEGQTKQKLGNAYIRTLVDSIVNEQLAEYFEEHPAAAKAILEKAMMANRAREAARKARESVRRKTGLESGQMPGSVFFSRMKLLNTLLLPLPQTSVSWRVSSNALPRTEIF